MRDNHPRNRQAQKRERKLERAKASRQGLPFLLIVCEGTETEPNYLRGLCEARRINAANVRIETGGSKTDALSLVKKARELFAKDKEYDRVFVVLDDDGQPLVEARNVAEKTLHTSAGARINVELIISRPAFEFWLLLHFEYTARPFVTAAEINSALRAHLTNYDKAEQQIFNQCAGGLDRAIASAERIRRESEINGPTSSATEIDKLIQQLLSMAKN